MVEIRGKGVRKVAIILTQEIKECIDQLNHTQADVGIPNTNNYVFARPTKQLLGHIWACDLLEVVHKTVRATTFKSTICDQHKTEKIHCNNISGAGAKGDRSGLACTTHGPRYQGTS